MVGVPPIHLLAPIAALCSLLLFAAVVRSCSKHGCSHFPVTVFISCFWQVSNSIDFSDSQFQAFFAILLPWPVTMASNWGQVLSILGFEWFALILMGLLPAQMLRQGVTKGRPIRLTKNLIINKTELANQSFHLQDTRLGFCNCLPSNPVCSLWAPPRDPRDLFPLPCLHSCYSCITGKGSHKKRFAFGKSFPNMGGWGG